MCENENIVKTIDLEVNGNELEFLLGDDSATSLIFHSENQTLEVSSQEQNDDQHLSDLLKKFDLENIFDYLKDANVTFRSLKYIQKDDLIEAVPHLGLRVEFREKLFAWRKSEFGIDDETLSVPTKVTDWLQNHASLSTDSSFLRVHGRILSKDLTELLNGTSRGKAVLAYATENQKLTASHRDDIINIIVEDVITNNIALKPEINFEIKEISVFTSPPLHLYPLNNGKTYVREQFI